MKICNIKIFYNVINMFLLLKTYFNGFVMHFFPIGAKIDKKSPRGQTWLGKIYFDKYIKNFIIYLAWFMQLIEC